MAHWRDFSAQSLRNGREKTAGCAEPLLTVIDALERTFVQKLFDRRSISFYEGVLTRRASMSA